MQVLPLQQPFGHEAASQTHWPPALHSCPVTQAAHATPPVPHELVDSLAYASHVPLVPPLQHPLGHVSALHEHRPLVVSQRLFAQGAHAMPREPQSAADCEDGWTHVLPLQHPVGQLDGPQLPDATSPPTSGEPVSPPPMLPSVASVPGTVPSGVASPPASAGSWVASPLASGLPSE